MTSATSSDVSGDLTVYPVYTVVAEWEDGSSHTAAFEVHFQSAVNNGIVGDASVEDVEAFLDAMASWAYTTLSGGSGLCNVQKIVQSTSTLTHEGD